MRRQDRFVDGPKRKESYQPQEGKMEKAETQMTPETKECEHVFVQATIKWDTHTEFQEPVCIECGRGMHD